MLPKAHLILHSRLSGCRWVITPWWLSGSLRCHKVILKNDFTGSRIIIWLPRWFSGKKSSCQCRKHGCDPRVGKIPWRRKWQPIPVFLPRKFHRQRSLVSYSPWGGKELDAIAHTRTIIYSRMVLSFLFSRGCLSLLRSTALNWSCSYND